MKNIFFTYAKNYCMTTQEYLQREHGFVTHAVVDDDNSISSHRKILQKLLNCLFYAIRNRKALNHSDHMLVVGHTAFLFFLLSKIGFLKVKRVYWYGFFIHHPDNIKFFKFLYRFISSERHLLIVYSKYELDYYAHKIGIDKNTFRYIPYGYMEEVFKENTEQEEDYFFAGGYSNRDYTSLLEVFRHNGKKLLIIGSKYNSDLNVENLPKNITIMKDVPGEVFEKKLKGAKAVILPFKNNTGASGQMVVLTCMMYKKAVVANSTDVIKEYVEDGISGIIIDDIKRQLDDALEKLENPNYRKKLSEALYSKFISTFTFNAVTKSISRMLLNEESDIDKLN